MKAKTKSPAIGDTFIAASARALKNEKSLTKEGPLPYSVDGAWENTPFTAHEAKAEWEVPKDLIGTLVGKETAHLNPEQVTDLVEVITEFKDLWDPPDGAIDVETGHIIELENKSESPFQGYYRVGPREEEIIEGIVQDWLNEGIIERVERSPFAAPCLLVKKHDGSSRLVIDYRRLNRITVKNKYPADDVQAIMGRLQGSQYYSKFDLANGFLQVVMEEGSRDATTFITMRGMYRFTRMPFGLVNSPATFARVMSQVMADTGLRYHGVEVYVDDVLIHNAAWKEHISHLRKVFTQFRAKNIKLKAKKCLLAATTVPFLGHVVSREGISPDPAKVKSVREWPIPSTAKQLHSFLGLSGYYRRYIRGYSSLAAPLFDLIKPKAPFVWSDECQQNFGKLKDALCSSPIVCAPDWEHQFYLLTDAATKSGIGCVLVQRIPEIDPKTQKSKVREKVIAYASKKLTDAEKRWPVREIEAWAIIWGCEHFRMYLSNGPFTIETDHCSLQWLFACNKPGRLNRWALRLQEFEYKIDYRKGSANANADALSRMFPEEEENAVSASLIGTSSLQVMDMGSLLSLSAPVALPDAWQIAKDQRADPLLLPIIQLKLKDAEEEESEYSKGIEGIPDEKAIVPSSPPREPTDEEKKLRKMADRYELIGEKEQAVLYFSVHIHGKEFRHQLVVPKSLQRPILVWYHVSPMGGHLGYTKTIARLTEHFYWDSIKKDLRRLLKECVSCACSRPSAVERNGLMQLRDDVGYPGEVVSIDLCGRLKPTARGNQYIVTFVDGFTLFVDVEVVPTKHAVSVAQAFYKYSSRHGCPRRIMTDQGKEFVAELMRDFCALMGITRSVVTAHHHQAMGSVERVHKVFKEALRAFIDDEYMIKDWDLLLFGIVSALNATRKRRLGCSPFFAERGRNMVMPAASIAPIPLPNMYHNDEFIREVAQSLSTVHARIRELSRQENEYDKKRYDISQRSIAFRPGDHVVLYSPRIGKLVRQWRGIYSIVRMETEVNVRIRHIDTNVEMTVHVQRLKPIELGPRYCLDESKEHPEYPVERKIDESPLSDTQPVDPTSAPSVATVEFKALTQPVQDLLALGSMIAFADRFRDEPTWSLGKILKVGKINVTIQYYNAFRPRTHRTVWKLVFYDPSDNDKEVWTNESGYRYKPWTLTVRKDTILLHNIQFSKKMTLKPEIMSELDSLLTKRIQRPF